MTIDNILNISKVTIKKVVELLKVEMKGKTILPYFRRGQYCK